MFYVAICLENIVSKNAWCISAFVVCPVIYFFCSWVQFWMCSFKRENFLQTILCIAGPRRLCELPAVEHLRDVSLFALLRNEELCWGIWGSGCCWGINQEKGYVWAVRFSFPWPWILYFFKMFCSLLASGSDDMHIRLWNAEGAALHCIKSGHLNNIFSVQFLPSGRDEVILSAAGNC